MRWPLLLVLIAVSGACSGAHVQTIQLVNRTPRAIEEVYIYPQGAVEHGKSRTSLAPNASASVQVKQGNIEVLAVSAKFQLDAHTRDRPSANLDVELKAPAQIVFYDDGQNPPELGRPGVFGVVFQMPKSNAPPATGAGSGEPKPPDPE
jgi:hypothetical protein